MAKAISKPVALAVALGLTLGGSFSVGAPAFAQNQVNEPNRATSAPAASQIAAGNNFSLTVHKKANAPTLRNATGEEDPQAGGKGVNDVPFQIQKLEGDVRNQAEYNRLVKLTNDYNGGNRDQQLTFDGQPQTGTTSGGGNLQFANLQAGAYLVTEQDSQDPSLIPGKPFIVMVPMTNSAGNAWNDHVHVYPKNSQVSVDKQVVDRSKHAEKAADAEAGEGAPALNRASDVEYTLTGVVPSAPEGKKLKNFTLTDKYNNTELRFDEGFVQSVERVPADSQDSVAGTALAAGQWEMVQNADTRDLPAGANSTFSIVVADPETAGLQPGDTLRVKVKATLLLAEDQNIENHLDSTGFFRDPGQDVGDEDKPDFDTPDDKVNTYIGKIKVIKHEEGNNDVRLAGARFNLFECGNKDAIIDTGVTNNQGELLFDGIHVSDFANNADVDAIEYCLEETEVPDGYTKVDGEIRVTLHQQQSQNNPEDQNGAIRLVSKSVANKPNSEVPLLPSTGGMGILLVALLGLGIIAGGVYAARRNSAKA